MSNDEKILEMLGLMQSGIKELNQNQAQTNSRLDSVGKSLDSVGRRLDAVEVRLDRVEKIQVRFETRVENEVIDKIRILFDGYSLRGDQIENLQKHLDERLDSIESDTRYLTSRVAKLEKLAK